MNHFAKSWVFHIVVAVGLWSPLSYSSVLPKISLQSEVSVEGSKIYLRDLLTMESRIPLESSGQIDKSVIALSPAPGKARVFESREVYQRLTELGITGDRYVIQVPDQIRVGRKAQTLSPNDIEERVKREFLSGLPWDDVQLAEIDVTENIVLPTGKVDLTFQYPPKTDLVKPFYLSITFRVNGQTVRRAYIRTVLTISDTLAVANQDIAPGDKIGADDVCWEKHELPSTLRPAVRNVDFFQNRKSRTHINAGQLLTEDLFVAAPLIKRGDSVVLLYKDEKIHISAQAQSLAAGSKGDRIRVVNVVSHKELIAEVVDEKTVRVVF
jgi:flagella basal body P-ring formation protein FlgA